MISTGPPVALRDYRGRKTGDIARVSTIAVAYDCPHTFQTHVLFYHQSLYVPSLQNHLVNPFQMRQAGIRVNDVALQHLYEDERTPFSHTTSFPEKNLKIPMTLEGIMSGFTVRTPTWEEVNDTEENNVTHVHMTLETPWDPTDDAFAADEQAIAEHRSAEWDLCLKKQRAISTLQVRGQDSGDCLNLNAASGDCVNYNVESLDDDYFLHPDAKALLDTGQSDLKPKSMLNPAKRCKSVELSEEDMAIAIYDPSQSAAVPMTPL